MGNPYSLAFGKMPANYIERDSEISEVIETFTDTEPSIRAYIFTGLRGCGKTVTLTRIEKELKENDDFLVLSLNSDLDLLETACEELYSIMTKYNILKKMDINISVMGVKAGIKERRESANLQLDQLLHTATKHGKRVLFCIDEVSATKNIKSFCQAFNVWLRKDYDVLILLTGLKKNILSLQGDERVSFLKRAERIELLNLSLNSITENYRNNLNITEKEAAEMAIFTKGYSYAFQVLGYLCYKNQKSYKDVKSEFEQKLADNVYDIIWDDLTSKEREIMSCIINSDYTAESIIRIGNLDKNTYNQYRRILITKGLLKEAGFGRIEITLPEFAGIAKKQLELGIWKI